MYSRLRPRSARPVFTAAIITIWVCIPCSTTTLLAQPATATLSGTVVDATGGAVADVEVKIFNLGTRLFRQTKTGADGEFVFAVLPPGRYSLTAERQGFTPLQVPEVVLNVDDRIALRLELKVAAVGESVTVIAEPPRVDTAPAVSTVVDRQFV